MWLSFCKEQEGTAIDLKKGASRSLTDLSPFVSLETVDVCISLRESEALLANVL